MRFYEDDYDLYELTKPKPVNFGLWSSDKLNEMYDATQVIKDALDDLSDNFDPGDWDSTNAAYLALKFKLLLLEDLMKEVEEPPEFEPEFDEISNSYFL